MSIQLYMSFSRYDVCQRFSKHRPAVSTPLDHLAEPDHATPRKAAISLYGLQFYDGDEERFARLGKHKMGAGCIWVNQLDDIDLDVLRELIAHAWLA